MPATGPRAGEAALWHLPFRIKCYLPFYVEDVKEQFTVMQEERLDRHRRTMYLSDITFKNIYLVDSH